MPVIGAVELEELPPPRRAGGPVDQHPVGRDRCPALAPALGTGPAVAHVQNPRVRIGRAERDRHREAGQHGASIPPAGALTAGYRGVQPVGQTRLVGAFTEQDRPCVTDKVLVRGCDGQPVIPPDRVTHQKGCTCFYIGQGLDNHILAGRVHLSLITLDARYLL